MATDIGADGARGLFGRRRFLEGAAALALGGAAAGVAVADEGLRLERREIFVPDLHPTHDQLDVVQLSDAHVGPLTPAERILEAVAEANRLAPDLVVLTGDYLAIDRAGVALVREQLAGLRAPTVAVLGNHDHRVDRQGAVRALERLGYCVLQNENTTLSLRGEPFTIVGIDDRVSGHADPARAMEGARTGSRLYLAHDPSTADVLRGAGLPMLVLSGHTHGGQVNIPGLSTVRMPYKAGLYELDPVQLYVNRGLGNTWLPVRVNAAPEVTLLTLRSGAAPRPTRRIP